MVPHLCDRVFEQLNELADHIVEWASPIDFDVVELAWVVFTGLLEDAERSLEERNNILMGSRQL